MLPYFEQPAWHLGFLTVHAFGVAVAVAVWLGLAVVQRRFARLGLDVQIGHRLGGWMMAGGVVGAHLFSVLFYFPHRLRGDPWLLLRVWEDISSFGGMLGGMAGAALFFAIRDRQIGRDARLAYLDAVAFAFPAALAIGRLGCALAHDHPGTITSFPFAISLESDAARQYITGTYAAAGLPVPDVATGMGFHDLGLYEFVFLTFVVVPLFGFWNRRDRPPGFYLMAFAALYVPVRFGLDMLRVADARYIGLTPAQWVSALVMTVLPFMLVRRREVRLAITAVVILTVAWACRAGSP